MMETAKNVVVDDPFAGVEPCSARVLTAAESWQRFDEAARYYLQMNGADFIRAWEAGRFDGQAERSEVVHVLMLRPLGR